MNEEISKVLKEIVLDSKKALKFIKNHKLTSNYYFIVKDTFINKIKIYVCADNKKKFIGIFPKSFEIILAKQAYNRYDNENYSLYTFKA